MRDRRIFLALDISDAARAACTAHVDSLRRNFPDARIGWERPEKLHMTLKFLGSISADMLGKLEERVSDIAADQRPFELRLSRPGVFPSSSRPRILWIGTEDPLGAVAPLYGEIEKECQQLGFEPEAKQFRPHITIGRIREPNRVKDLAQAHLKTEIEPVGFEVADVVIYESKLQPTGSIYSVVSRARLGERR